MYSYSASEIFPLLRPFVGIMTSTGSIIESRSDSRSPLKILRTWPFHDVVFKRTAKKLQRRTLLIENLFGDVLVAVVVCVRSVLKIRQRPGRFPVCPVSAGVLRVSFGKHKRARITNSFDAA